MKHCPFAGKGFAECYCHNLTSFYVPKVVFFCMEHFKDCEIYQKINQLNSKEFILQK